MPLTLSRKRGQSIMVGESTELYVESITKGPYDSRRVTIVLLCNGFTRVATLGLRDSLNFAGTFYSITGFSSSGAAIAIDAPREVKIVRREVPIRRAMLGELRRSGRAAIAAEVASQA